MKHRLTERAERDIRQIFRDSFRLFGERQARKYHEIIDCGVAALMEDASRPTAKHRPEIHPSVRSLHLQLIAKR